MSESPVTPPTPMRKGWFRIPGVQDGDRDLEQQLLGLDPMLAETSGRTVLDLGCAEGLIARECAQAGAKAVTAVEIVPGNAEEARRQCVGLPVAVHCQNVEEFVEQHFQRALEGRLQYDVVLALAILHKLRSPERTLAFIGHVTRHLAVIRTAERTPGFIQDARSEMHVVKVRKPLKKRGLRLEQVQDGPYTEWTGYFRRVVPAGGA